MDLVELWHLQADATSTVSLIQLASDRDVYTPSITVNQRTLKLLA
jgi:hypothetical protein